MGKLCKDQTVEKLVGIFKDMPANEIDEVVASAKKRVSEESKEARKKELETLFDKQIQTLKDRGCPEAIIGMLRGQKPEVIEKASKMTVAKGNLDFLLVISRLALTIYSQMQMVLYDGKAGYNYLDPREITDVVETPDELVYAIYDVEDGQAMLGKAPQDAEKLIKKEGRRCLTEVEVIALGVHTDVLSRHYVDATGSRYESSDQMPSLSLGPGRPELDWNCLDGADEEWGSASCRSK